MVVPTTVRDAMCAAWARGMVATEGVSVRQALPRDNSDGG